MAAAFFFAQIHWRINRGIKGMELKDGLKTENKRGIYARYSFFTVFFYISVSLSNYISVFLQEYGFTGTQIGAIISVSSVISAVSLPVWGIVSDKLGSARKTLVICMAAYASAFFLVPGALGAAGLLLPGIIFIIISRSFTASCNNLAVGWTVKQTAFHGISYSSVRLWGSIGFAGMMTLLGFVMPHTGTNVIFYLTAATAAVSMASFFTIKEYKAPEKKESRLSLKPGRILKNYYFITYLVMVVGLVLYDSLTAVYMPFLIKSIGAPTTSAALVMGVRCLFEMIAMLGAARLKKRFPLPCLLIAAGILSTAEHMLYGTAGSLAIILMISVMSGVSNGTFLGLGPSYVFSIVPSELNNTAQTLCGSVSMGTAILGSFAGGVLIDKIGVTSLFFGCGLVILFITIFFAASLAAGRRVTGAATPKSVYLPVDKF